MARTPRTGKPASPATQPARRGGARAIGQLLPAAGGMALRRFGFTSTELVARWPEIVGPTYARWTVPAGLGRRRRAAGGATGSVLTIRAAGPFALQIQHAVPIIIERANRILGHGAIASIRIVQGDVPGLRGRAGEPLAQEPATDPAAPPGPSLSRIGDPGLRAALEELAAAIATTRGPPRIS